MPKMDHSRPQNFISRNLGKVVLKQLNLLLLPYIFVFAKIALNSLFVAKIHAVCPTRVFFSHRFQFFKFFVGIKQEKTTCNCFA